VSGGKTITPTGRQSAPVTYRCVAPDAKGTTTTVHPESRSRRGVATIDVSFFTGRPKYIASGGSHIEMSGTIANIDGAFDLTGTGGDGVEYSFHFSERGTFHYEGTQQGCREEGQGTFNAELSAGELTGSVVMQTAKVAVTCRGRTMSRANRPPVTDNLTAEQ
jgi:hypothetical protein